MLISLPDVERPSWSNHKATKMGVTVEKKASVQISARKSWLKIAKVFPARAGHHPEEDDLCKVEASFRVEWQITFGWEEATSGSLVFSETELKWAFGLKEGSHVGARHFLVTRYGAESAFQGHFIRTGPYLNIPGPGTGENSDPNVSIVLYDTIREAVQRLIDA
ncbi:MAG: hypothetical protein ABIA47_02240 [bacterium]